MTLPVVTGTDQNELRQAAQDSTYSNQHVFLFNINSQ